MSEIITIAATTVAVFCAGMGVGFLLAHTFGVSKEREGEQTLPTETSHD